MFWIWRCYGLLRTLHCHKDRYCDVTMIWPLLFHGIRADVSETPNNALTTRMHVDNRLSIARFFAGFNAICYTFLRNNAIYIEERNCRLSTVPGLFNKCSGPRTPYRVDGLAEGVMRAWASHSLVNHWNYNFKAYVNYMCVLDKRNTAWLRETVRQTSRGKSVAAGPAVRPAVADFPRDVCLTVSRNHAVFLLFRSTSDQLIRSKVNR